MNVGSSREQVEKDTLNVVQLFGTSQQIIIDDPLNDLIHEALINDVVVEALDVKVRKIVREDQFPDLSMYILQEQLSSLKSNLNRIKFYLDDLDDLLQR